MLQFFLLLRSHNQRITQLSEPFFSHLYRLYWTDWASGRRQMLSFSSTNLNCVGVVVKKKTYCFILNRISNQIKPFKSKQYLFCNLNKKCSLSCGHALFKWVCGESSRVCRHSSNLSDQTLRLEVTGRILTATITLDLQIKTGQAASFNLNNLLHVNPCTSAVIKTVLMHNSCHLKLSYSKHTQTHLLIQSNILFYIILLHIYVFIFLFLHYISAP